LIVDAVWFDGEQTVNIRKHFISWLAPWTYTSPY